MFLVDCRILDIQYGVLQTCLWSLILLPLLSSAASNDCTISYCGQSLNGVRFPFRLTNQQPKNCGFAGFDLRCAFPNMLLINLPSSGEFSVRSIDYRSQTIRIYDSLNCLPARLLTFNLSNSPFSALYFQPRTLLSCPSNVTAILAFKYIVCLSNSSFSAFATDSKTDLTSMICGSGCRITGQLKVPVDQPYNYWYRSPLDDEDITLTWGKPDCMKCERVGRSCGYGNSNTQRTKCYSSLDDSQAPTPSGVTRVIAFAVAIPTIAASFALACFACHKDCNHGTTITAVTPEGAIVPPSIVGFDQATIESYTEVVLGESKRLPGHEDAACAICYSEYHVEETVRCIPECRHCFHAECIDKWLKMNSTCPVCRNSPSPVHVEL